MYNDGTVSMTITRVNFSKLSLSLLPMLLLSWPIHMINALVESTFKAAKFNAAVIDQVSSIVWLHHLVVAEHINVFTR